MLLIAPHPLSMEALERMVRARGDRDFRSLINIDAEMLHAFAGYIKIARCDGRLVYFVRSDTEGMYWLEREFATLECGLEDFRKLYDDHPIPSAELQGWELRRARHSEDRAVEGDGRYKTPRKSDERPRNVYRSYLIMLIIINTPDCTIISRFCGSD
ncbi:hypothetical protein EIP91_007859 [Steccherinum ochraceum]|uniref:Uncharacterized protein n=1 Tax=Steccherinum ochraceum TaxID=92696 RepID=A0A4R0R3P4_9APHY|nr:hypothetical protein EIP91_007859 [Steccherinum ochraceum]